MVTLNQVIAALNDIREHPHIGKFDPESLRTSNNAALRTKQPQESVAILFTRGDLSEFVDSAIQRHTFSLQPNGAAVFTLEGLLKAASTGARPIDPRRLEAALLDLKDETRQARAFNGLASALLNKR